MDPTPLRRCRNCSHDADVHGDRAVAACSIEMIVKGTAGTYRSPRQQRCTCPGYWEAAPAC